MSPKTCQDVDTATAASVVEEERAISLATSHQQEERERLIAQSYEVAGQIKVAKMFSKFGDITSLMWLKQVKESRIYRDLPGIGTWEEYCKYLGLDRHTVDQDLLNLTAFGDAFLVTCHQLQVGYRDLRKLRQLAHDGMVVVDAECVEIGGERIPLGVEHKEDLQAAIERILDDKAAALDDAKATVKAKDRVLASKEDVIKKQEKELQKLSRESAARDLLPEEDAFLQRMENLRTSFDGYMLKVDPDAVMTDFGTGEVTQRMRSALISTLAYMRMQVLGAYDVAVTNYGDPSMTPELMEDFEAWEKKQA